MQKPSIEQVTGKIGYLRGAELLAQKLNASFIELMGLIKDDRLHRWQELGQPRFPHCQVSKKKVVIDHHHVRREGLAARLVDMADTPTRALRTQTVVAGGCDERNPRRALMKVAELGQIARDAGLGPELDAGQNGQLLAVRRVSVQPGELEAVLTEVAGPPLEHRGLQRQGQRLHQTWQVTAKQLVLQGLGGSRQQHPVPTEQRWHQVGKGLADARAGFNHQHAALLQGTGDGLRHVQLARPQTEFMGHPRQGTLLGKSLFNPPLQAHGSTQPLAAQGTADWASHGAGVLPSSLGNLPRILSNCSAPFCCRSAAFKASSWRRSRSSRAR